MEILTNIGIVFLLLLFFGASIFVHELGHFLVARWCGLKIEVFSIGFGPAIWKRKVGGVVYKVGLFPLGGYVALPQLDPTGMSRLQGEEGGEAALPLPPIAVWKKLLVSVAGAVGNLLFAVLIAWVVFWRGVPATPAEVSSVVGYVSPDSVAHAEGLRMGDQILSVGGKTVKTWGDFRLLSALDAEAEIEVRHVDGAVGRYVLPTEKGWMGEQMVPGIDGASLCMVLAVESGMSAAEAGIKRGDIIYRFDGETLYSRGHLQQLVMERAGRSVPVGIKRMTGRTAEEIETMVTPAYDPATKLVRIGITFNQEAVEEGALIHPTPSSQIKDHAQAIFRFLGALTTPRQSKAAAGAVGGPVAIVFSYWIIFKISIMKALWFTGFLNVNLAILNLLPIPVLDGGHICFALYEGIRGKPLSPRLVSILVNAFAFMLIGLFLLLSVRDVRRFF